MRSAARLALLLGFGSTAGCSLIFGIRAEDYTDGAHEGGIPPGQDAHGNDGPDARADASADASADAAHSPCLDAPAHLFCDDFDQTGTLEDRGWGRLLSNTGQVDVDAVDARSAPRSVWTQITAKAFAAIARDFNSVDPSGDLHLGFDMHVERFVGAGAVAVLSVSTYLFRLLIASDGKYAADEYNTVNNAQVGHTVGAKIGNLWVNVQMSMHFVKNRGAGSRMKITMDGNVVMDTAIAPTVDTGAPGVSLGVLDQPEASIRMRFDNVTFDRNP